MTPPPTRTTSMLSPLTLRSDIARDDAITYWATTHATKVTKLPHICEYNQRLFSATDHGFWPASSTVGTIVSPDWCFDGCAEVRFTGTLPMLATGAHARPVYLDEQNVFATVLGHPTGPGGGRWFTDGFDDALTQHVALLLRRRQGLRARSFRAFVHDKLSAALLAAGAKDLRTYTFLPWTPLAHTSLGVGHHNPVEHRFHAMAIFGTTSRQAVDDMLDTPSITALVAAQHEVLTAVHAYAVERSLPIIRMGQRP
jgi:hypothetical protein